MRKLLSFILVSIAIIGNSQTTQDLLNPDYKGITWLGIDYSHVKLIGEFTQFGEIGSLSSTQIRDKYFRAWNNLIFAEADKYDIKKMLHKESMRFNIDMLMEINNTANTEDMDAFKQPNYSYDDIKNFVSVYDIEGKNGIGVLFIAECLDKNHEEAYYHFVALNMKTKEIIIHEKILGKPGGFGLRNYWAGSINSVIKTIRKKRYKEWEKTYN